MADDLVQEIEDTVETHPVIRFHIVDKGDHYAVECHSHVDRELADEVAEAFTEAIGERIDEFDDGVVEVLMHTGIDDHQLSFAVNGSFPPGADIDMKFFSGILDKVFEPFIEKLIPGVKVMSTHLFDDTTLLN